MSMDFSFNLDDQKLSPGVYHCKVLDTKYSVSEKGWKSMVVQCAIQGGNFNGFPFRLFVAIPEPGHEYYRLQLASFQAFANACAGQELDGEQKLEAVETPDGGYTFPIFDEAEFWAYLETTSEGYVQVQRDKNKKEMFLLSQPTSVENAGF